MNEQDSGVEVDRECLTEGGNSIVGAASFASPCERNYKTSNDFLQRVKPNLPFFHVKLALRPTSFLYYKGGDSIFFGALASEAVRQLSSFSRSGYLIDQSLISQKCAHACALLM